LALTSSSDIKKRKAILESALTVGKQVIGVRGNHRGHIGRVTACPVLNDPTSPPLTVAWEVVPPEPSVSAVTGIHSPAVSMNSICTKTGLSGDVVGKLLSQFIVEGTDFGLGFKVNTLAD
jgi:hypothetical protein